MKTYLGDGVYADLDDFGSIILTVENGIDITNTIYLEDEVIEVLLNFVNNIREIQNEQPNIETQTT
jgi:hypothetical protein